MNETPVCAQCGQPMHGPHILIHGVEVHAGRCAAQLSDELGARWIELIVSDAMSEIDAELAFLLDGA